MSELNATAAALLSLLHDGPQNGGQLYASANRFRSFFHVSRSQVYRELHTLTGAGLLRLGRQGPRGSLEYIITSAGKKRFKEWLTEPSGPDQLRSSTILRLLHASALTAPRRRALVTSAKRVYGVELEAAKGAATAATDPYAKAIADYTVARLKAALKLLDAIPV